jgi:hypothetical protein
MRIMRIMHNLGSLTMKYKRSLSALALMATLGLSLSACGGSPSAKSASVASSQQSSTATPTATNPANSTCLTASENQKYNDDVFVCTMGSDQRLVWLSESESKRVVALKAAADKAAADKVIADKAAAEKAAVDKAAADKVAADKVAADKAAADKAAAAKAAAAKTVPVAPVAPAVPAAPAAAPFANCTAARAAGAAPVYRGTPGYGTHLDRDADGIGCDK